MSEGRVPLSVFLLAQLGVTTAGKMQEGETEREGGA